MEMEPFSLLGVIGIVVDTNFHLLTIDKDDGQIGMGLTLSDLLEDVSGATVVCLAEARGVDVGDVPCAFQCSSRAG